MKKIMLIAAASLALGFTACGPEAADIHQPASTATSPKTIPPDPGEPDFDPTPHMVITSTDTGTLEVDASEDHFGFIPEENPRVFADQAAFEDWLTDTLGVDPTTNTLDSTIKGMPVYVDFHTDGVAYDVPRPAATVYEVTDFSLATLGGLTGIVTIDGTDVCVDPDGVCTGLPSYFVEQEDFATFEAKRPEERTKTISPNLSVYGKSYRTRAEGWPFFTFAAVGNIAEGRRPHPKPLIAAYDRTWIFAWPPAYSTYNDPNGIRTDSDYDCYNYHFRIIYSSGTPIALGYKYICILDPSSNPMTASTNGAYVSTAPGGRAGPYLLPSSSASTGGWGRRVRSERKFEEWNAPFYTGGTLYLVDEVCGNSFSSHALDSGVVSTTWGSSDTNCNGIVGFGYAD